MKRILAVVAALATATAVLMLPAPAQAGPAQERYISISSTGDQLGWFWIDQLEGIIGCAKCVWRIDLKKSHELTAANEKLFQSSLMSGLGNLSAAKVADPRTAAALKAQALADFQAGARALGTARASVGVVGYYNLDTRQTTAADRAWLAAADQDLADGFANLQAAATDPSPNPWIVAAQKEFDKAYAEIAGKAVL
jgi:hypothetical protein